jgi:hypothetical protein
MVSKSSLASEEREHALTINPTKRDRLPALQSAVPAIRQCRGAPCRAVAFD